MRLPPPCRSDGSKTDDNLEAGEELVRSLASRIGVPLEIVDVRGVFERFVIRPFMKAYQQGLTPNPCVLCNPKIKFGFLLHAARRLGADCLATGHYARIIPPASATGRFQLYRARDLTKDQSYFLFGLNQKQMAAARFPLGAHTKQEVLTWAEKEGFAPLLHRESQEICFIPSGNYCEFLQSRAGASPMVRTGPIVDLTGKHLGDHRGIFAYTIGQRRGLGIASTAPYYVVALEPTTNTVRVGRLHQLFCSEFQVQNVNWVSIPPPQRPISCRVRIRNQHRPAPALVTCPGESDLARVRFDRPQRAVTPGQAAVFYNEDLVLGGGTITRHLLRAAPVAEDTGSCD